MKRIVITSSVTAMFPFGIVKGPNVTVDETHWADESVSAVKERGVNASAVTKFSASKTLAEKGFRIFEFAMPLALSLTTS